MPVVIPRLIVEVFQHTNFRGRMGYVLEPVPHTGRIGFQDNISSLRVFKGPNFSGSPNYKALLYQHVNYKGKKLALGPGFYPNIHDVAFNFADRISSINFGSTIDVVGPEWGTIPVIVDCFEHVEFKGKKITILRDIANLRDPQGGTWFEDRISSIRMFKGPDFPPDGAEVVFYEHPDFEGGKLQVRMEPSEFKKEFPNLHLLPQSFGDSISAIKIEGWASSGEFTEMVFDDEFIGNDMRPEWRWVDPQGGGGWTERQGYLEMRTDPGQDLWHGPNGRDGDMDAPRLLMEVTEDFAIETRMRIAPQLREHGGLLVWKNENQFLRLEKTSGPHAFRGDVRFERHVNRRFGLVARGGMRNVRELFLRLERRGNQFSAFASEDGIHWRGVGITRVAMGPRVQVGLHALCPGNIPPTLTRFDYFRLFKRRSEAAQYRPIVAEQLDERSDEERVRELADERRRAMRDVF